MNVQAVRVTNEVLTSMLQYMYVCSPAVICWCFSAIPTLISMRTSIHLISDTILGC